MEAGHAGQNVYLQAEALGLGTCAVAGVAGAGYVREAFAIPANEVGLYLMPVGYYN
jgi:nitroreductase